MKKDMNISLMLVLIIVFLLFYFTANHFLKSWGTNKTEINNQTIKNDDKSYNDEKIIVNNLYSDVRILYDVVNNKFKVSQDDSIIMGDITYKKITNFDLVMNNLFTDKGIKKYISDMGNYFAYTEEGYYLAGNLVSYQTYYFRGDNTNIYVLDAKDNYIKAIIYEKWTSNNKNTLATIEVVKENNEWLIDDITILSEE